MSYVFWTARAFDIGVSAFDEEHRELYRSLNALCDAVAISDRQGTRVRLQEAEAKVREHFAHEERLMFEHGYPEYETHRRAHEDLLIELEFTALRLSFFHDHDIALFHANHFSYRMLAHILTVDALYDPFFRAKPPVDAPPNRSAA